MFVIHSVKKTGREIDRQLYAIHLSQALSELFKIYDSNGDPCSPQVEKRIDAAIDHSMMEVGGSKARLQGQLYTLLRAKDIQHFVTADADLVPLKLKLLELMRFERSLEARWAAVRELLLSRLDPICGLALAGIPGNQERYKRHCSERGSRLGRLLLCTALLNFDLDEEHPPTNLRIRFHRRDFPEHSWTPEPMAIAAIEQDALRAWRPSNPYCRWEYLGLDLLHACYRQQRRPVGHHAATIEGEGGPDQPLEVEEVYCVLAGNAAQGAGDQLELLSLQPRAFMAELQRRVYRAHGAEGVRLFALLCVELGKSSQDCAFFLSLGDLAALPGGGGDSAARRRSRAKKLWAILNDLAQVELTRIRQVSPAKDQTPEPAHPQTFYQSSRLIIILEVSAPQSGAVGGQTAWECPQQVRLMLDGAFYRRAGAQLRQAYRDLPEPLFQLDCKLHPYALGLLAYLRMGWSEEGQKPGVVECSAAQLLEEGGFWIKESGRYRALETLKRDLGFLKEQGWLGSWRLTRSGKRDGLQDRYRLKAPGLSAAGRDCPEVFAEVSAELSG